VSPRARHLGLLALLALAVRLPVLFLSPGAPYDMDSYARVAACPGPGLYSSTALLGHYPYLPLWWLIVKAMSLLQGIFGGDPGVWLRLPGVAGDVVLCGLIYLLAQRRSLGSSPAAGRRAAWIAAVSWALNPLAILISAAHGQFDSLALACVLGMAWLLEYSEGSRAETWAALALGAAVALKTWPLAFLPLALGVFSSRKDRLRFCAIAALPCLVLLAPWIAMDSLGAVADRLSYTGAGVLGLTGAIKALFFVGQDPAYPDFFRDPAVLRAVGLGLKACTLGLLAAAALWSLQRVRSIKLLEGLPWAALTLVLLAPALSVQYLAWAPALALAVSPSLGWRLSLAALPLAVVFYALFMPAVLAGPSAWAPPVQSPGVLLAWAGLNLAWWFWTLGEWRRAGDCARIRRPQHPLRMKGV
jgi:hypothetical protein